jgi:hypothetical protein
MLLVSFSRICRLYLLTTCAGRWTLTPSTAFDAFGSAVQASYTSRSRGVSLSRREASIGAV